DRRGPVPARRARPLDGHRRPAAALLAARRAAGPAPVVAPAGGRGGRGGRPQPSWRLDGPPDVPLSSLTRRAVVSALATPVQAQRFASAREAAGALEGALGTEAGGPRPRALFPG